MSKTKEETYVTFGIAPYCLAKLLLAMHQQNIYDFWLTQIDDNLFVRIPVSHLEKIVYHIKDRCESTNTGMNIMKGIKQ